MAQENTVKIEGLRRLARELKRAETSELTDDFKTAAKEAAELVATTARHEVPVVSGKLRDSIRAAGTARAAFVRAGKKAVPYAGPIHFGWIRRGIKPNPFLYDALDRRQAEVVDIFVKRVEEIIDKLDNPSGRD